MSDDLPQVKGIEGVLARRYPQVYERLKALSEQTGQSILDLLVSYTNWALDIREYGSYITEQELKKITPEALYTALRFLMFFEDRYIRLASYVNVSNALAIFDAIRQLLVQSTVSTSQQQTTQVLPIIPPQPSTVDRFVNAIIKAIDMFSMGRSELRKELAKDIASELIKLSQQQQQTSQ